jgi:hypothetical protein
MFSNLWTIVGKKYPNEVIMRNRKNIVLIILVLLIVPIGVASAEDDFEVTISVDYTCEEVGLIITTDGGTGPFSLSIDFGDEEEPIQMEVETFPLPLPLSHSYPGQGEYEISVKVIDIDGLEGELEQEIAIEGPEVTLDSDPFPPLLTLEAGEAKISFTTIREGGNGPFVFDWELDGEEPLEISDADMSTTEFIYTEAGDYEASVKVTDACGFSASDELKVVVLDDDLTEDEEEKEGERACHPMAEKIAQAVSSLTNKEDLYNCEDIYDIFRGILTDGAQVGFGRLWHAYKMASVIPDLTWEDIRDWKLAGSSWGLLNQVNRFAETVDEVGISEMVKLVLSGDNSIGEIRTAMRMTLRYEAEFYDALGRISTGASKGELGQLYKLAQDLELDLAVLDGYLSDGSSLSEVRHASKLSDRTGTALNEILDAHGNGSGWGEINQAHRLADEGLGVAEILAMGVNEYRQLLREEGRLERVTERDERMIERDERIAVQFGEKYSTSKEEVMALYNGECEWKWACVRAILRDRTAENASSDRDARTLEKVATQFGVEPGVVSTQLAACGGDWSCVRAHFRDLAKGERGNK